MRNEDWAVLNHPHHRPPPPCPQSSWVIHRGGMTRGHFLNPDNGHAALFRDKHGIGAEDFKISMLNNCHPAAMDTSGYRFSLKEATT